MNWWSDQHPGYHDRNLFFFFLSKILSSWLWPIWSLSANVNQEWKCQNVSYTLKESTTKEETCSVDMEFSQLKDLGKTWNFYIFPILFITLHAAERRIHIVTAHNSLTGFLNYSARAQKMCRRMLNFWAINVTCRRSLQESMALQRWPQLSKEKQKFLEPKWVFELMTPESGCLGGNLPAGWEKSQGLKVNPGSLWLQKDQQELFCAFWNNTSLMKEINEFRVSITVKEKNLKYVFNFQQAGNLLLYATRLLIRYKASCCFVF